MSEERRETRSYYWVALAIPCMLALYLLSVGPVGGALNRSGIAYDSPAGKAARAFYAPILYVSDRHEGARELLTQYIQWFQ